MNLSPNPLNQTLLERVILVVLDGVGAGELPDAHLYGDVGSNTLAHTAEAVGGLSLPTMQALGLGNILPLLGVPPVPKPEGLYGRLREASAGKDTITGHWELAGVVLSQPFPTFPHGFPQALLHEFEARIGTPTIGNYPASGTVIIQELGEKHLRTGYPIVYTSADSVFQIAMHEEKIPIERQYEICRIARELLRGEYEVGRVICRPFTGSPGQFQRTERRKDFPVAPPHNLLDSVFEAGKGVHAIGKIYEIFNGRSITQWDHTTNNAAHTQALFAAVQSSTCHLIFANLEDFDMLYGHRNNPQGMAQALETWDRALPEIVEALHPTDLLIITADHGNDPTTPSTDHSREYPFLLLYSPHMQRGFSVGDRETYADIAETVRAILGLELSGRGTSLLADIRRAFGEG